MEHTLIQLKKDFWTLKQSLLQHQHPFLPCLSMKLIEICWSVTSYTYVIKEASLKYLVLYYLFGAMLSWHTRREKPTSFSNSPNWWTSRVSIRTTKTLPPNWWDI